MKKFLIVLVALVAVASATNLPREVDEKLAARLLSLVSPQGKAEPIGVEPYEIEAMGEDEEEDEEEAHFVDAESRGWILNAEGKKAVKNVLQTMPCGWPEAGIPPLAPYRQEEMTINMKKSFVDMLTELIRFRVDGLDKMVINKLKISYTFNKKVKYNFTFPKIKISGKYISDTFMNLMKEYGLTVRYDADGMFEIELNNLTLDGTFKYKMPWLFGSIKIYKFKILVTLGNAQVKFTNLLGNGLLNEVLTEKVEETIMWAINGNQAEVSKKIEEVVVPTVNAKLKGHKIWSVLFGSSSSSTCVPPPDPWA